ncbi:MAG: copper amine oxidase N-terminal domain-containing protein [Peptococcaceae bacterium]|nr:copper amine oxidase N-terminal domain-containing protein [Peptococcaceae bacterium]
MKKKIAVVLFSLVMLLVMAGVAESTLATRQITANYQDIKIFVNGKAISLQPNEEPFIYSDRTFVPLRAVAEALGCNVEWVDALKYVNISGGADSTVLAQKEKEIQDLKAQLAQKNSEVQSLQSTIDSLREDENDDIDDLEDDLASDFDNLGDVIIDDISLDGDEDEVDVDIEVDLGDYEDEWADLDDDDIKDWIEDLVSDIQAGLSDDTEVAGQIIDTDSDDVLVEFSKDGDEDLDVDFYDDDYRESDSDAEDVEDSLDGDIFDVGGIEFEITDVDYDGDDGVTVTLYMTDDYDSSDWDGLSDSNIENDVEDICEEIADTFEDADISLETVTIYFYDDDDDLLSSFDYDVSDGELY